MERGKKAYDASFRRSALSVRAVVAMCCLTPGGMLLDSDLEIGDEKKICTDPTVTGDYNENITYIRMFDYAPAIDSTNCDSGAWRIELYSKGLGTLTHAECTDKECLFKTD
jgi:hypothetical protein